MPRVGLQPVAKSEAALLTYIDANFRRIADAIESLAEFQQGIQAVTGSIIVETGLVEVHNVIVSFNTAPTSNACFLHGYMVGSSAPGQIQIDVYNSAFALSPIQVNIAWFVIGE